MKYLIALCGLMVILAGCATGGSKRLDSARLQQIQPGVTTKADLIAWFGPPMNQELETNGRSIAKWHHVQAHAYVVTTSIKHQILSVTFTPEDVVEKFLIQDDLAPRL